MSEYLKCPKHMVAHHYQELERGKTRQYCPQCEAEQISDLKNFFGKMQKKLGEEIQKSMFTTVAIAEQPLKFDVFCCRECGALVMDRTKHTEFHAG